MEHDYYWSYDKKTTPTASYRVYWRDRTTSTEVCSTETRIFGQEKDVAQALLLTAMSLRAEKSSLFIEPEQKIELMEAING